MVRPVRGGRWWALAAAVAASVVWVGPASAETTLEVEAGYAGAFIPGQEVPVRVRVTADRLVRGTLEVAVGSPENGVPVAMAVEVPGGGQKQFLITAPAGLNPNPEVTARLRQDDRVLASGKAGVRAANETELVGILPGALRGRAVPGPAPLAIDAGTARFAAIGEAELEGAPASFGPLSTLVADVDDLSRMSPAARAGVLRWMERGGRLMVDAAKGQTVPGLPDAWQPGSRGRAAAGLGEVVVTDGAIAANRWSNLVEPSGWGSYSARFAGDMALSFTLARDAGLRTPEIAWLVGFLAVYVVAVGPILFFAVRRRGRPELAWVAVPLIAILFSSGSYVVGRNLRKSTQLVHASVLTTGAGGPVATSYLGVFSRGGETARVGFPSGWTSGPFAELGAAATSSVMNLTADGPDVRVPLEAGQFGMVYATGPASDAGGLEVKAATDAGGRVTGIVRNATSLALDPVAVFVGSATGVVGALRPGEERPFVLPNAGVPRMDGGGDDFSVWAGSAQMMQEDGPVDFGLWQAALRQGGLNYMASDNVVAAGWTRDFVPEIRVSGNTSKPKGRTVVLARAPVTPAAQAPLLLTARRDIVRDPFASRGRPIGGVGGSVVRFVLPAGTDPSKLVVQSPVGSVELWQDGAWKATTCDPTQCLDGVNIGGGFVQGICPPGAVKCAPPQPIGIGPVSGAVIPVPVAAVKDSVVYARTQGAVSIDQGVAFSIERAK